MTYTAWLTQHGFLEVRQEMMFPRTLKATKEMHLKYKFDFKITEKGNSIPEIYKVIVYYSLKSSIRIGKLALN